MTEQPDFKVIDLPAMLSRKVEKPDANDPGKWQTDSEWYKKIQEIYITLFGFFVENDLIIPNKIPPRVDDKLTIYQSDLTEIGRSLVLKGSVDRWVASKDRLGASIMDVSYLDRQLRSAAKSKKVR